MNARGPLGAGGGNKFQNFQNFQKYCHSISLQMTRNTDLKQKKNIFFFFLILPNPHLDPLNGQIRMKWDWIDISGIHKA